MVPWEYWQPAQLPFHADNSEIFTVEVIQQMEEETANPFDYRCSVPDGAVDLSDLNKAETMEQYCSELSQLNATFYPDPSQSAEAARSGLFDTSILTAIWQVFTGWVPEIERGDVELPDPSFEDRGPVNSRCVVS